MQEWDARKLGAFQNCDPTAHDGRDCGNKQLQKFKFPLITVDWFEGLGLGLLAGEPLTADTIIGVYTGIKVGVT